VENVWRWGWTAKAVICSSGQTTSKPNFKNMLGRRPAWKKVYRANVRPENTKSRQWLFE